MPSPVYHAGEQSDILDWYRLSPDEIVKILVEASSQNDFLFRERPYNFYGWVRKTRNLIKHINV